MQRFDAIIAGGGIAGSTTAAALAQRGLSVLVCEAGLPSEKRLAGELMHPPAARDLEAVGLLDALRDAGGVPVYGFAVFRSADDPGMLLSYSEIPGGSSAGIALEHALMTRTLLAEVARRDRVTVWDGARVVDADVNAAEPVVKVKRGGEELLVTAPLVVSAEGRASAMRQRTGIACHEDAPFRMVGWKIPEGRLPFPGYGHLFIGGPTATLAYQVSRSDVRIMFELELEDAVDPSEAHLAALPPRLRADVVRAMATCPRQTAKVCATNAERVSQGRLAIVGDAGGCVHPLTASGISFCTKDAMRLAASIGSTFGGGSGVEAALRRYDADRTIPMLTRTALGPALVDALCSRDPDMRLLRHGLFRYWKRSSRGRGVSMGLLATERSSMLEMAREYALVCAHALTGVPAGVVPARELLPAVAGLARRSSGYLKQALFPGQK